MIVVDTESNDERTRPPVRRVPDSTWRLRRDTLNETSTDELSTRS
jgi:hypothetical protein